MIVPTEVMLMRFGEALAKRRKEANLSQEQLAEKLHVSRQAVSKWESDQSTPDIYTIQQISEIVGVSIDSLMSGKRQEKKDNSQRDRTIWIILSIFMIVVFISGTILLILSLFFYKDVFEPLPVWLSLILCGVAFLYFIVTAIIHQLRSRK